MENKMFCFQCEQTAGCTACTGKAGVCGKKEDTALLQDELTGALIGLARAMEGKTPLDDSTYEVMLKGLFMTVTNVSFDNEVILSRLVDTFFSRISLTMQPPPKPHSTACVLPWEEGRHWQSRSSGCSSS